LKLKNLVGVLGLFVAIFIALLYVFDGVPTENKKGLESVQPADAAAPAANVPAMISTDASKAPERKPSSQIPTGPLRGSALDDYVKFLEKRYKTKFEKSLTPDGVPFRLSGTVKLGKKPGQSNSDALLEFLGEVAPALEIDQIQQLSKSKDQTATLGQITSFSQSFEGILVEGSQVRIHQDSQGNVFMVNSTYVPGVSGVDLTERISSDQAREISYADAVSRYPAAPNQIPLVRAPVKVIFKFSDGVELSWKVVISQPWAGIDGMSIYYVNARTGNFERRRGAVE
jgi:hypothetical protein